MTWQPMTSVYVALTPVQPWPSSTLTVIGKLPDCVGVPESTPPAENVRPAGRTPLLSENVAPPMAPLCEKIWLKAAFTVPVVVAGFVTVTTWQLMMRLYVGPTPVQPPASVTLTVIGNVPLPVGVPERTPAAESVRPGGSVPVLSAKLTGVVPPVCANVWLNALPAVPVVTAGFWTATPGQVTVSVN